MANTSRNEDYQVRDLSGSINLAPQNTATTSSNSQNRSQPVNTPETNGNMDPNMRGIEIGQALAIQRVLEDKVKKMVRDEMIDVKKTIGDLATAVQELTRSRGDNDNRGNVLVNNIDERPDGRSHPTFSNPVHNGQENGNEDLGLPSGSQNLQLGHFNSNNRRSDNTPTYFSESTRDNMPLMRRDNETLKLRIDKFGLNFNGNTRQMSIDTFIFRLEHLQEQYKIPWSEVLRDFHVLVSGQAEEWFWLGVKTRQFCDWPGLKHALRSRYQNTTSNCEIMRDLVERKQQLNESVDSYFHNMCQIRSTLIQPISEYDMIRILKRNIKESIGKIIYPMNISSVEQLRLESNEAERMFPKRAPRDFQQHRHLRQVNEIYSNDHVYSQEDNEGNVDYEEVEAIRINPGYSRQKLTCWNCRLQGHGFMDCPSPKRALFCYRCGKPDVTAPVCPACQENRKGGMGKTGAPRSSETPVN